MDDKWSEKNGRDLGTPIVSYVIDSVSNHNLLNAPTQREGEIVFNIKLADSLPPLSQLHERDNAFLGKNSDIYDYEFEGRTFLVKSLKQFDLISGANDEERFKYLNDELQRVNQYYGHEMAETYLISRQSKDKGGLEYLIVQEEVRGTQLKKLQESKTSLAQPLTQEMRDSVIRILSAYSRMFNETHMVVDFDLIFDIENNRVRLFDFDAQGETMYWNREQMLKLRELGIDVPDEMIPPPIILDD